MWTNLCNTTQYSSMKTYIHMAYVPFSFQIKCQIIFVMTLRCLMYSFDLARWRRQQLQKSIIILFYQNINGYLKKKKQYQWPLTVGINSSFKCKLIHSWCLVVTWISAIMFSKNNLAFQYTYWKLKKKNKWKYNQSMFKGQ